MPTARRQLSLRPIGDDPEVGRWLSAIQEARARTLSELAEVPDSMLDTRAVPQLGTIGDLLYHIGLIEVDWLLSDILGLPDDRWPAWIAEEFPIDDRDAAGQLSRVPAQPMARHLQRLARVRDLFVDSVRTMTAAEFARTRPRGANDVSPAWATHHLLQHEAEHRSHIALIRDVSRSE